MIALTLEDQKMYAREIVAAFYGLSEALPTEETMRIKCTTKEQEAAATRMRIEYFPLVLARVGTHEQPIAFCYFGEGPVGLRFDGTGGACQFIVSVIRIKGYRPTVPYDQARSTYLRLIEACVRRGLNRETVKAMLWFRGRGRQL